MPTRTSIPHADLAVRQDFLILANIRLLEQGLRLLDSIDDRVYREATRLFPKLRAGAHLRHILEFYECFLQGIDFGHVDYGARRRDESVENIRIVAAARIRSIIARLESNPSLRGDSILWVRMEEGSDCVRDSFLTSSPARELQALSSHTIHHYALVAVALGAHGVEVENDFGVAPSTLKYMAARATPVAAEAA
jgi:hypothetical protein